MFSFFLFYLIWMTACEKYMSEKLLSTLFIFSSSTNHTMNFYILYRHKYTHIHTHRINTHIMISYIGGWFMDSNFISFNDYGIFIAASFVSLNFLLCLRFWSNIIIWLTTTKKQHKKYLHCRWHNFCSSYRHKELRGGFFVEETEGGVIVFIL